jgi:phosphate uptake regulator
LHLYGDYSEKRALAIVEGDRELDEAYARACNTIYGLIEANPSQAEHLVRVMECFHALEHVGDHAVAIAGHLEMLHRRYAV